LVGGRLGYVLFYKFGAYLAEPWRIFFIWEGGMSFHGGFLGVPLLSFYAAGLGVPFLLAALFTRELAGRLKGLRRFGTALQIAAGLILVAMGIAMITGQLSSFAFWLLRIFPGLGTIG
ncbi:MAG: prolipoprotein diacylglyceryl transferase family protein, partial [Noviherbaspirillum sp.]